MANQMYVFPFSLPLPEPGTCVYIHCDTVAEMDAQTQWPEGSLAYVHSNHRMYFWDATTWRQIRY